MERTPFLQSHLLYPVSAGNQLLTIFFLFSSRQTGIIQMDRETFQQSVSAWDVLVSSWAASSRWKQLQLQLSQLSCFRSVLLFVLFICSQRVAFLMRVALFSPIGIPSCNFVAQTFLAYNWKIYGKTQQVLNYEAW